MDTQFKKFIYEQCHKSASRLLIGILAILCLSVGAIYIGVSDNNPSYLFIGGILLIVIILVSLWSIKEANVGKGDQWLKIIEHEPDTVLWVLPLLQKETLTLSQEMAEEHLYRIYTSRGNRVSINCKSDEEHRTFLNGIIKHLPNAHFGYSQKTNFLFKISDLDFIQALKDENLYVPCRSLTPKK